MTAPEPGLRSKPTQTKEWGAALALLPAAATLSFYALPVSFQEQPLVQFVPQIVAYIALGLWAARNCNIAARLGLEKRAARDGVRWGLLTGLLLGGLNTFVIFGRMSGLVHELS